MDIKNLRPDPMDYKVHFCVFRFSPRYLFQLSLSAHIEHLVLLRRSADHPIQVHGNVQGSRRKKLEICHATVVSKCSLAPSVSHFYSSGSNFMQMLSCFCHIAAIFVSELKECAEAVDCIADLVTMSVAGCMLVQIDAEIKDTQVSSSEA